MIGARSIKKREHLGVAALMLVCSGGGLIQEKVATAQTTVSPTIDPVAQQLRADKNRRDAVDAVVGGMQIANANLIISPHESLVREKINDLNVVIDNNWIGDIPLTLTRGIGLRPEAAPKLTQAIVDTVFARSPPPTLVFGFCAILPSSACTNRDPYTDANLHAMRGFVQYPLTPDLAINRVLSIAKPAGVAIGAALAAQNQQSARAIRPLEPSNVEATLILCEANQTSVPLSRCIQAGAGLYFARKGMSN